MITYLTQLTICWTILFAVYYLFLRRETFFVYNRWFLLAGLTIGLIIPLIDWTLLIIHETESFGHIYVAPVQTQVHQIDVYMASTDQSPWWYLLLMGIYFVGLLVTSAKLIQGILEILSLRQGAEISQQTGYELVLTRQHHMPFSFMNSVYWSGDLYRESDEKDRILAHEARHVSSLHSLDILFIEILCVLFWFHPMVYIYRKEIKEVHEYEADAAACVLGSRKAYGQLLINQANSGLQLALANHFFYSQLKNRFKMMTRKPSSRTAKLKYLIAIPIIGLAVLVFSFVNKDTTTIDPSIYVTDTLMPPPPPPAPVPKIGDTVFLDHKQYIIESTDVLYVNGSRIGSITDELIRQYSVKGPWILEMYKGEEARDKFGNDISTGVYSIRKHDTKSTLWVGQSFATPSGQVMVLESTDVLLINGQNKGFATQDNIDKYIGAQKWSFTIHKGDEAKNKYGISEGTSVLDIELLRPVSRPTSIDEDLKEDIRQNGEIFRVVEQMPRFPGCEDQTGSNQEIKLCADKKMLEFLYTNIQYPQKARSNGIEGNVVISFIIEKDGSLTNPKVIRDPGAGLGEEAVRIVNMMADLPQKWSPGVQRGHKVRVQFILPVKFQIEPKEKKEDTYYKRINFADFPNELPDNSPNKIGHGNKTVVGKVIDMEGHPAPGVSVIIKGSRTGTATDFDGNYRLSGVDMNDELTFISKEGLFIRELPVNSHYLLSAIVQLPTVKMYPTPLAVEEVYKGNIVDALPRYPGCEGLIGSVDEKNKCAEKRFLTYLYKHIGYPEIARNNIVQGQVIASFVVKKDGTIGHVRILRDLGAGLGEEVEQLLKSMNKQGKWTPAMKDGKPINFQMTLPVTFKLKGENVLPDIKKVNMDQAVNPLSEIVVVGYADPSAKSHIPFDVNDEIQKAMQEGTLKSLSEINVASHDSKTLSIRKVKKDNSDNSLSEVVVMGYPNKSKSVSTDETSALIVLDGFIMGRAEGSKNLKFVDPNNIKSVSVLKAEKAIEKYGDQGKYGVIVITTKEPVFKQPNAELKLSSFNLYPNPASSELAVDFKGPAGDYHMEVVDGKGATQVNKDLHNQSHSKVMLDIAGLNSGIYYMIIRSGSKATAKVFVKE